MSIDVEWKGRLPRGTRLPRVGLSLRPAAVPAACRPSRLALLTHSPRLRAQHVPSVQSSRKNPPAAAAVGDSARSLGVCRQQHRGSSCVLDDGTLSTTTRVVTNDRCAGHLSRLRLSGPRRCSLAGRFCKQGRIDPTHHTRLVGYLSDSCRASVHQYAVVGHQFGATTRLVVVSTV